MYRYALPRRPGSFSALWPCSVMLKCPPSLNGANMATLLVASCFTCRGGGNARLPRTSQTYEVTIAGRRLVRKLDW